MQSLRILAIAMMAAFGAVQLAGCASDSDRTAGQTLDDAAITAKVKTALSTQRDIKTSDVNVNTHQGIVQLAGFVHSEEAARRAAEIARNVSGVKSVKNDLVVVPPRS